MENEETIRQRKKKITKTEEETNQPDIKLKPSISKDEITLGSTFWLTRIMFLRYLGVIYAVAFLVAYHQNKELIGDNGLLPLKNYMRRINDNIKPDERTFTNKFQQLPTLFWLLEPWQRVNTALDYISLTGIAISLLIVVTGSANSLALYILWLLYHTIVNVGQQWYSFGWESQLLETGFLAIFTVPFLSWRYLPKDHSSPWISVVFYRWLIMRIMLGAGLIKIRGDQCWLDLTCMNYFYETQPNPNPISYFAHQAPEWWHKFETFGNHMVELIFPLFTIIPLRLAGMINGSVQILFQLILISTGNLSFLNWLTIAPSIWFFDDRFMSRFFTNKTVKDVHDVEKMIKSAPDTKSKFRGRFYRGLHIVIALLLSYLSYPIVMNLLSPGQVMNTSYEPFRIVNTYGAFGSVTKNRTEVIMEGTWHDDPRDPKAVWMEYDFKCKPGDVKQTPCFISPYHYRLDWLMWFAAFQRYEMNPWMPHLAGKMLQNDPALDVLIKSNPFKSGPPPKYVRASHYSYSYTKLGTKATSGGSWWKRKYIGQYMQPFSIATIGPLYDYFGWDDLNKY